LRRSPNRSVQISAIFFHRGVTRLEPKKMKIKNLKNKNREAVGGAELARRLGIHAAAIATLAADGVLTRTSRGRYALKQSVTGYCAHARRSASGRESEAVLQRRRLIRSQADYAEARARIEAGTLVASADVLAQWSGVLRTIRAMTMAIPGRAASRLPNLSRRDVSEIDYAVRDALIAAARDRNANHREDILETTTSQPED
jgi:phage terminase Nu1 subunit (DNA packaging protein)